MYKLFVLILTFLLSAILPMNRLEVQAKPRLQDYGDKLVIVIDPGHGGENQGTIENNFEEKGMDMTTALAMYEELVKYDNVQVFLTRTEDKDLSLRERAQFAASVEADFLFSIHYNASASHELFGSEVWVSAFTPYNSYGYQFGYELLQDMESRGLVNRGVKTKLGESSGKDYYGIIRESVALGIPAAIIEHCHVDESHDYTYCDTEEELKAFGIADATAVAKYFGLKSSILGVDYTNYDLVNVDADSLVSITLKDDTEPDFCQIEVESANYEECTLNLTVTATDYQSPLLYYSYSLDGGETFVQKEPWPGNNTLTNEYDASFTLKLSIPSGTIPKVIVRAYNMFDLYTESNLYESSRSFLLPEPVSTQAPPSFTIMPMEPDRPVVSDTIEEDQDIWDIIKIALVGIIILLSLIILIQNITYRTKKRRPARKKSSGKKANAFETKSTIMEETITSETSSETE